MKYIISTSFSRFFILSTAMLVCGWLSVRMGKDLTWDLANYHYYNPYAFLHNRYNIDFWPNSFMHQYLNPGIDFLSYFLINYLSPRMTEFILGAIHGINVWLLFLIACRFLSGWSRIILALIIAITGMYGAIAYAGIGSFHNDDLVSIFILGFILLQVNLWRRHVPGERLPVKEMLFSGFLLGLAMGLKLTAGLFLVSALCTAIILPIAFRDRVKLILLLAAAAVAGMLISSGYWMFAMWQQHHNLFFPFFNRVFYSPDFPRANLRDARFMPHGILQTIFYSFYFSWNGQSSDSLFMDLRFPIVYILFVIAGIRWFYFRIISAPKRGTDPALFWMVAYYLLTYLIWQYSLSNSRYLVALEMLTPLMIYLLLEQITKKAVVFYCLLGFLFYLCIIYMIPAGTLRIKTYQGNFMNIRLPDSVSSLNKATVLVAYSAFAMDNYPRPQTYLIPFFPSAWRFVGVPFIQHRYVADIAAASGIYAHLTNAEGKIYLLTSSYNLSDLYQAARGFGLIADGPCAEVISDRQQRLKEPVWLCPLKRRGILMQ